MRFIAIYKTNELRPPTPAEIEAMGKFIDETVKAGVLLATEGFGPSTSQDAHLRLENGTFTVTDGPFTESKEVIGGFAIMQVKSREEVLEWTRRFLKIAGDGVCEIHPLSEMSPVEASRKP